jgi:hypothetical protein
MVQRGSAAKQSLKKNKKKIAKLTKGSSLINGLT